MRKIYLIKHAAPLVHPGIPTDQWPISRGGKGKARELADQLATAEIVAVACSPEPKAEQTAQILASTLGVESQSFPGLHEHERRKVPVMATPEYISAMAQVFLHPDQLILGEETATQALQRFAGAYEQVLAQHSEGNLAIVSHGTVIALFIASISHENAFAIWRRMSLPSFVVIEEPEHLLLQNPGT